MLLGGAGVSLALPECSGSHTWSNCFGTYSNANGDKYVGEWRDGKPHGQGTHVWGPSAKSAGDKYVGEWRDGKNHGQGTYTFTDGRVMEGIWKDGKFQYAQKVTPPVTMGASNQSTVTVTFTSNSVGGVLVQAGNKHGGLPYTLKFQISAENQRSGGAWIEKGHVEWPNGSRTNFDRFYLDLKKNSRYIIIL